MNGKDKEAALQRALAYSENEAKRREGAPYGHMCRNPDLCKGKSYCPRDPTCGD